MYIIISLQTHKGREINVNDYFVISITLQITLLQAP